VWPPFLFTRSLTPPPTSRGRPPKQSPSSAGECRAPRPAGAFCETPLPAPGGKDALDASTEAPPWSRERGRGVGCSCEFGQAKVATRGSVYGPARRGVAGLVRYNVVFTF